MARYRPFVEAVQWTGSNVIEVRQFVRAATGIINDAIIRDGILYLTVGSGGGGVNFETLIPVPQNNWVVKTTTQVTTLTSTEFAAQYIAEA